MYLLNIYAFLMKPIQRLDQYRRFKKIKAAVFEENIGYSRNSFSNAVSRGYGIKSDTIILIISHYPDLNLNWLFTGNGNMIIKKEIREIASFDKPNLNYIYELMEKIDPDNHYLEHSSNLKKEVIRLYSIYETLKDEISSLKNMTDNL